MATFEIKHEIGIQASPEKLYSALTKRDELARWWTGDTRGDGSRSGGSLEFWFGEFCQKMTVTALEPQQLVRWKATQAGVPEWQDTEIEFRLEPDSTNNQTIVHFRHLGWRENTGMFPHCSMKWAVFMMSLKELLETGKGRPYPDDYQVNHN